VCIFHLHWYCVYVRRLMFEGRVLGVHTCLHAAVKQILYVYVQSDEEAGIKSC
jgi:hypothetical protein